MFQRNLPTKVCWRHFTPVRLLLVVLVFTSLVSVAVVRQRYAFAHTDSCECEKQVEFQPRTKYRLLILIMSSPTKAATRQVIRETWLARREEGVKHLFVLGTRQLNRDVLAEIQEENRIHADLLILDEFVESYESLTEKVLLTFRRTVQDFLFDFVLKCDDDTFVNVAKVLATLSIKPQERLYWGYFKGGGQVKRSGKWKESEWFLCDTYLPYAYGGGYVLSTDLVAYIARNQQLLQKYKNEDVSVGVWLSPLKINRVHDVLFDTGYKSRGCFNDYLVTHKQSPGMMRDKHNSLSATGKMCAEENREGFSYVYNWTVPASQCCKGFVNKSLP